MRACHCKLAGVQAVACARACGLSPAPPAPHQSVHIKGQCRLPQLRVCYPSLACMPSVTFTGRIRTVYAPSRGDGDGAATVVVEGEGECVAAGVDGVDPFMCALREVDEDGNVVASGGEATGGDGGDGGSSREEVVVGGESKSLLGCLRATPCKPCCAP